MKKLENKPHVFAIHDKVITPISERRGQIIKIEEKPIGRYGNYYEGMPLTYKRYTIELKLPCKESDSFMPVTIICRENELKI